MKKYNCFPAGVKIKMANGTNKNIEDVIVGDSVVSFNINTKTLENKLVTNVYTRTSADFIEYKLDNGMILKCTEDHPIFIKDYQLASNRPPDFDMYDGIESTDSIIDFIKKEDIVYVMDGVTEAVLMEMKVIMPKIVAPTYIFTVEDNHNFFANEILVHNE